MIYIVDLLWLTWPCFTVFVTGLIKQKRKQLLDSGEQDLFSGSGTLGRRAPGSLWAFLPQTHEIGVIVGESKRLILNSCRHGIGPVIGIMQRVT